MNFYQAVTMNEKDQVAVALKNVKKNSIVEFVHNNETIKVVLKEDIDFGHKFSIVPIRQGEKILKYGEVIGAATRDIEVGEHVHVHNLEGTRGRGDQVG